MSIVEEKLQASRNRPQSERGLAIGYLPINLLQAVVAIAAVWVLTRILDPQQYGLYAMAFAGIQMAQGLAFGWLNGGLLRFYAPAKKEGRLDLHLATGYGAFALLAGLIAIAAAIAIPTLAPLDARPLLWAALAALIARSLMLMNLDLHRASCRPGRYSALDGLQLILGLGLGAGLAFAGAGLAAEIVWGLALANGACALADMAASRRSWVGARVSWAHVRLLATYGLPLSLATLLGLVVTLSDRLIIGWILGPDSAGPYAVAFALAERPVGIVFGWLGMAFLPAAIAALERDGPASAQAVLRQGFDSFMMLGIPAAMGVAMIAEPLAAVLAGPAFRHQVAEIIPWIAAASFLNGLMVHFAAHAFLLGGRTSPLSATIAVAALLSIGFNLVLLPVLGVKGAAISALIANGLGLWLRLAWARRVFAVPLPLGPVLRSAAASLIMAMTVYALDASGTWSGLVLAIVVGAAVYGLAGLALDVGGSRRIVFSRVNRFRGR